MKKFAIILWSALAAVMLFLFATAACSSDKHVLKHVNALAATCETAGNEVYYTCSHCDKLFADEKAEREVTLSEVTVPALSHLYDGYAKDDEKHWQLCIRMDCGHQTEKAVHDFTDGDCVCGEKKPAQPQPEVHSLSLVEAADVTCETAGNKIYYTCSHCDKVFADEKAEREVTLSEVTVPALNHLYDGYAKGAEGHWQICTREECGHETSITAHIPDSLDWGKADQTCCDCGYTLHEKLFVAIEEPQQITISKNMSGNSTITTREAGNYIINTENGDINGNFYNFTGTAGQYIIITGGGITGTGAGTPRAVYGMYFKNYGESAFTLKYYLENNGAIPATTEMITLQPGELRYVEMVADVHTFTSTPYSRIELGADATDAKLALASFKIGTLADGAVKLSLPQDMAFSDGTTEKYVTTVLGNELLATLKFTVPQGALGFYNEFDNSFWLADEGEKVSPVINGDAVLRPLTAKGEWTAKKVQPRATGSSNGNAITVSDGINPSGTGAGTVSTAGEGGYTETCVLYSVNAQNAGVNVVAGCGSFLSKSMSLRLAKITVTRVSGEINFKHYVGNIGAGTALTTFEANLNAENEVVEYCFLIPANLDMGDSKHVIFNILKDMQGSASFTMQCSVIDVI